MPSIPTKKQVSIDPLNPPENIICLSILQYADSKGQQIVDVQCSLMKDLRNEDMVMSLLDEAKVALTSWYKEHKNRKSEMTVENSQSDMEKR